jgi:inorganic pyrophosphatase
MERHLQKSHPWHGISPGEEAPYKIACFIEIVRGDTVKYEIDKSTGFLTIDRPQRFSNVAPALYGFVPRTYCGDLVGEYCAEQSGRSVQGGDGDPLDVLVLTEHHIPRGDILVKAIPIGGLRMIDKGEADDKIVAVLEGDALYADVHDITDLPVGVLEKLRHYFLTYKLAPGSTDQPVDLAGVYGRAEAHEVIRRSLEDYRFCFG